MKKTSTYKNTLRTIIRVIIYLRVSTEDQARREDNSLDTQKIFCERLIALNEKRNWRLVKIITDAGHSAKNLKRPGIEELKHEIKSDQVDVIVIYRLDRLTRSMHDLYKLFEIMESNDVAFASATESFDSSTPDGRAALNQRMTFAQWEREMTVQRMQDKFAEDARKGKWHPSMTPYGYDPDTKNKTLIVNEKEARIIKVIYSMAAIGKSLKAIANHINKLGSRSRKRIFNRGQEKEREVGGRKWTVKTVRSHLENPKYKAVTRDRMGNEYPAIWKAIVNEKLWNQANRVLQQNRQQGERPKASVNKHELVLKGLIKCEHCGGAMSPRPGGRKLADGSQRAYYCCQDVIDFGESSKCQLRNLPGNSFDAFLIRIIGAYSQHPKIIKATLKAALDEKKKSVRPLRSQQRELTRQLKEIDTEIKNLLGHARKSKGSFSKEFYDDADELADQKRAIEVQRDQLKTQIRYKEQVAADEETVARALGNFSKAYHALPFEDREEFIGLLIKKLNVALIDPTVDQFPCDHDAFESHKPVKWYRIKIEFYIQSIFERQPVNGINAEFDPEETKSVRTRMDSTFIAGLIGQDWRTGAFLTHPFPLERNVPNPTLKLPKFRILKGKHILASVLEWRSILNSHPELHSADIAEQVGLSSIRIRHLLQLIRLNSEIIETVLKMPPAKAKKKISIKSLERICRLSPSDQTKAFNSLMPDGHSPNQ